MLPNTPDKATVRAGACEATFIVDAIRNEDIMLTVSLGSGFGGKRKEKEEREVGGRRPDRGGLYKLTGSGPGAFFRVSVSGELDS